MNKGFTLIETAAVTIVVGILAALGTPSLMGMMARNALKTDMNRVKGALQEAQRAAIKQGTQCNVAITAPNSVTSACFTEAVELDSNTSFVPSPTGFNQISFSFKGNLTANPSTGSGTGTGTGERLLIFSNTRTTAQKCLAIATGIGLFRGGDYEGGVCQSGF
jgi:prepilin-type N-terminal cleavage/methylation domain-containing protein